MKESFTSRGRGTPSISGDRKHTKPKRQKTFEYKDVAQARDYPKSTKNRNQPDSMNFTSSTLPSLRRSLVDQGCSDFSTKQTTTATVICPRFCPASKRETQGRKRTENEHGSSKHATSPATVRKTYPNNLPPIPPSARSRSTATTVQPRDSTVSPLLNKRVRCVVDEANGLMHLRPRESTYSARECSAKHRHELWFTFNQSAYWEKKVEGKPAKHIMLG